ncbi:MAG: hypothetical protein KGL41_03485 [Actinomycetales bacterium]|nr:hypothetical protein [Actinomycetales bacterium]
MTTRRFHANAYLDGNWWMVEIPEVNGLTQAKKLTEVTLMAREFIAVTLDIPIDSFEIELTIERVHDLDVAQRVAKIQNEKALAAEYERQATEESQILARDLANQKLTVREIGVILGVSHQRAHQLLSA